MSKPPVPGPAVPIQTETPVIDLFATPSAQNEGVGSQRTPIATVVQTGSGRAHKGCQNKAYSIFTRILCIEDFFAGVGVSNINSPLCRGAA